MADRLYLKDWEYLLEMAEAQSSIGKSEQDFIEDLRHQQESYGEHTFISQAQLDWLSAIAER